MSDATIRHMQYLGASCLLFFFLLTLAVFYCNNSLIGIDKWWQEVVISTYSISIINFMRIATYMGSAYVAYPIGIVIAAILWQYKEKVLSYRFFGVFFLSVTLVYFFKHLVARARPTGNLIFAKGNSFPSGHATQSLVLSASIMFLLYCKGYCSKRMAIVITLVVSGIVGFSRTYLQVHYLSDVLGGYLLGLVLLFFILFTYTSDA